MNSEFAVNLYISIKKFVVKFNIVTVNMNNSNPPSSKKKKKKLFQKKLLISGVVVMILIESNMQNMYPIFAANSSRRQSKRFAWISSRYYVKVC